MRVKSKSAVLHMLLGSPNYISGQELANRLGVSRQTVGKCVQQAAAERRVSGQFFGGGR